MNMTTETLEPRDFLSVTPTLAAPDSQNAAMLLPAVQAAREGAPSQMTRQITIIQDM
jgi:hypothetical protein